MLLTHEVQDVGKTGVLESAKATIKTSPKIFSFFADQTYANKPRAICRELVANAVDSHVMAGKPNEPVEVWLPSLVDPVFKVRDFGLGMEHSFVMGPFMQYADGSTKDQSNIAIGGFGIGSKSPFAYTDSFTLRSVFDGTMSVYSVFKDEDGIPSIALLAQKSTDEPNGVEVSFPVEPSDFENFKNAALEALMYFDPLPILRGAGNTRVEGPKYAAKGKTWGMRATSGPLQVIMGGVMYPVDVNNLTYKFSDQTARQMLNYGLDIRVPIGTCSVALSREQLSYDDRTTQGLTDACKLVVDEVAKSFSTMFDQHKTLWDAKQALYKEVYPSGTQRYGGQSVRGQFLAASALYRGQKLEIEHTFLVPGGMTLWDLDPANYRRGSKTPNPKWEHYTQQPVTIRPGMFENVIIDDLPPGGKSKTIMKLKEFLVDQPQQERTLVVRPYDHEKQTVKQILTALGNPSKYVLTSSLPEPQSATVLASTNAPRPKVRMFTYDGSKIYGGWSGNKNYPDNLMPTQWSGKGVTEIEYKDQPASGTLVVLETWKPPAGFFDKMDTGLIAWNELHFVNKSDAGKLDETKWTPFETLFQKRLAKKISAVAGLGEQLAVEQVFDHNLANLFRRRTFVYTNNKQRSSAFAALESIFRQYVLPIKDDDRKFAPFVKVALPRGVDPVKLVEKLKDKSPRAYRLLQLFGYRINNDDDLAFFLENI